MRRRKFGNAITHLRSYFNEYRGSYEYYLMLGTCYLYVGDIGNAMHNYEQARSIKPEGTELYLGQAAIFIHQQKTDKALQYYLEILNFAPSNATAKAAMEFIRANGSDAAAVKEWVETGRVQRFYPPLGMNPLWIRLGVFVGFLTGLCISAGILIGMYRTHQEERNKDPVVQNVNNLGIDKETERKNPYLSSNEVHFSLTEEEVAKTYDAARAFVLADRDNAAMREINIILNSDASDIYKSNAKALKSQLFSKGIGFESKFLKSDRFGYKEVYADPLQYLDCYVVWDGRLVNVVPADENGFQRFTLLEGYVDKITLHGPVDVICYMEPSEKLDGERPIRVLGQVKEEGGKAVLYAYSYWQPMYDTKKMDSFNPAGQ